MNIKKIFKWLANIIQILLGVFSLIIYYLSDKKMGLMRSLTYKNDVYNKLSLKIWLIYGILFIFSLAIITLVREYKRSAKVKECIVYILASVLLIIFAIKLNTEIVLSYYVLVISFSILLCIQLIKFNFSNKK